MPDIAVGDKPKRMVRLAMWWLRKKLAEGKDRDEIHDDIMNCGNPVIRVVHQIIREAGDHIKEPYQNALIKDGSDLGFWVIYKDTAYRDPFFYILRNILEQKEKLMPMLDEYLKKPEDWYINTWTRTKEHTAKLKAAGEISIDDMSPDEKIFVPQYQTKMIYDEIDKEMKKEGGKRGWLLTESKDGGKPK